MTVVERDKLVITSEEDAWNILRSALNEEFDPINPPKLEFSGWPTLQIHIEEGNSSITPSMMEGFISLQEAIYRAHALVSRGSRKLTVLTDEDKDALELNIKVGGGSSLFDIDPKDVLESFVSQMGNRMDGNQWLILGVTVAILWFSRTALVEYLNYLKDKRKDEVISKDKIALLESQKFSSEHETERMKILISAMSQNSILPSIEEEANAAKRDMLKALPQVGESTIAGVEISGEVAHEIVKNPRRRSEEVVLDGLFMILRVDTTAPDGFRVRLIDLSSERVITAGVQDLLLSESQRQIIQAAEWAKAPIRATIEAKERGGEFIDAIIRTVEPHTVTATG